MTDKPPPRPPRPPPPRSPIHPSSSPPSLPKPPRHPGHAEEPQRESSRDSNKESTAPRKSAPPPLPKSGNSDEDATKLFSNTIADEAELVVIRGEFEGKSVKLGAGTVVIGRSSECELMLRAASGVSRRHSKVQFLGNRFVIVDLESRNGTIVNGVSVERKVLENGDKIEIGDELVQFVVHSMADLRAPAADVSIDELPTAQLPRAVSLPPTPPPRESQSLLPETLPPQSARTAPEPAPTSFPLPPSQPPPPPSESRGAGIYVFGAVSVAILGGLCFLGYDLFFNKSDDHVVVIVDAGAAAAVKDAGSTVVAAVAVKDAGFAAVDAGSAVVDAGSAVVDAGSAVVVADAGSAAAVVVDAGSKAANVDAGSDAAVVFVRATIGGRVEEVLVNVGDVVAVGAPLVVVAGENFNIKKKLDTLRSEERDFAAVVDKSDSARADLAGVRAEIKKLEGRLKPQTQKAAKAGTVKEIMVKPGETLRDGFVLLTLTP